MRLRLLPLVSILVLWTLPGPSTSFHHVPSYTEEERDNWIKAVELFHLLSHPHKQTLLTTLKDIVSDTSVRISPECRISLRSFANGVTTGNLSQMMMFDSFSKPLGIMSSQGFNLGSHRQCLKVGRYILLGIRFPMPEDESITRLYPLEDGEQEVEGMEEWMIEYSKNIGFFRGYPFYASICVPDDCSEIDVRKVFNSTLIVDHIEPLRLELASSESYADPWSVTIMQVIFFLILSGIVNLCTLSTIMIYFLPDNGISAKLQPFDLYKNTMDLWSDRKTSSSEDLTSVFDLFRIVHLLFGFFAHCIFGMSSILLFRTQVFTSSYNPTLEDFFKGVPVSIGFTCIISAAISSCHWLRIMSEGRDVSFARFAIGKILRPMPVTLFMILFYAGMPTIPFIGPFGKLVQQDMSSKCLDYGWREMVFINNLYPVDQVCNLINWLTAVDVQLYLASFVILLIMSRSHKAGLLLLGIVIAIGTAASGIYSITNNLPVYLNLNIDMVFKTTTNLHKIMYHTIHYVPVYGIGMMLGYILFLQDGKKKDVSAKYLLTSMLPLVALTIFSARAYDEEYVFYYGDFAESAYTVTARLVSSVCTAVLFYTFLNTSHPVITYINDSKIMIVTARLSYCMFASHSVFINIILSSLETQLTTTLFLVLMYLSVLVFGFIFANFLYVFVEAPFRQVMWRLLSAVDGKETEKKTQ